MGVAAGAGRVSYGSSWRRRFWRLFRRQNLTLSTRLTAAIVADTTLFEHIQHLLWTTLPSFLLAAVKFYLIAGHSNMLWANVRRSVTDIIHSLGHIPF